MLYNRNTISVYDDGIAKLLNQCSLRKLSNFSVSDRIHRKSISAVGQVNIDKPMRELDAYVAVGSAFSLLRFTGSRSRGFAGSTRISELVNFVNVPDAPDIVHLQCLQAPYYERTGILVGRHDGKVELWEDRQPRKPAVIYKESIGSALRSYSVPPNNPTPVVDTPSHSFMAMPMMNCGAIGLWHLKTGELMNLMTYAPWFNSKSSEMFSPVLVLRSQWGHGSSTWPLCGPMLMAIQDRYVDIFY